MDKKFFKELNPSQKRAVEHLNGPLLVLAGAGTGKTRVITYRIANLIANKIKPEQILGLTFTNKAAKEMKERINSLLDSDAASKLFIGTFHAFCMRVLRYEVKSTSLYPGFVVADSLDQKGILKQVITELKLSEDDENFYLIKIGRAKQELKSATQYSLGASTNKEENIARVYLKYQEMLLTQNMLDFDDILNYTIDVWQKNPEILEKYQEIYKYILVDEFQDTNYAQFELISLLADKYKNLCVVGDDDQSIYGWRGAKIENILNFPNSYKNTVIIKLEQNYRSTNNILNAANAFISGNNHRHNKKLWSDKNSGEKIRIATLAEDIEEAKFISKQIRKLLYEDTTLRYNDIAILYRSNHQSRLFEKQFRYDQIPYKIVGSKSFYERKEVRDAIAYLKIISNPKDDQSLLRILGVPSRGLGQKFVEKVRSFQFLGRSILEVFMDGNFRSSLAQKQLDEVISFSNTVKYWSAQFSEPGNLATKVKSYFYDINFLNCFQKIYKNLQESEERKENVLELINAMTEFENNGNIQSATLPNYLETICLSDDSDDVEGEKEKDSVTLLTVHSAKGLEFKCVFIVGMEQNIFPHSRSLELNQIDEERRLFYVAITRAKDVLYLTNAQFRLRYGTKTPQIPSVFLSEFPNDLVKHLIGPSQSKLINNTVVSEYLRQLREQYGIN